MKTVTFHSYKGGTGKSFLSLNVAAFLSIQNYRVALIDFDTRAPSVYHRFQPDISKTHWLNEYLDSKISFTKVMKDYSHLIQSEGKFFIGFASPKTRDMQEMQIKSRQWQQKALTLLMRAIVDLKNKFDWIILDSSPGVTYDSLNAMSSSDAVILVSTPDYADILGTNEMCLEIWPSLMKFGARPSLVLNKVPRESMDSEELYNTDHIIKELSDNTDIACIANIPAYCDKSVLTEKIFILEYESHPLTNHVRNLTNSIISLIK
ncbi:MAG: Septum site-determining protein MinD [Candidatus Heimdallarchaeota archaeon LC_3]|nr:MAG: Septum site-determining protein MinD [Candidatus Heimdallarchaeota archaeon LC_3]